MKTTEQVSLELAAALREVIEAQTTNSVSDERIVEATALARQLAETLAGEPHPLAWQSSFGTDRNVRYFSPVTGPGNPASPPIEFTWSDNELSGVAVLGRRFGGPPGYVHGGISALIIDEMVGQVAVRAGHWGMTASLAVTYLNALPLGVELLFRARVVSVEGRKTRVEASIALAGEPGTAYVTADALMIQPRPDTHERYFGGDAAEPGTAPN